MIKVLLALDESPSSFRAAQTAARLFSGSEADLLVINVARTPAPWLPATGFGLVAAPPPNWQDIVVPADEADLARWAEAAGATPSEVIAEVGDPVDCICAAAEDHDVDVVVVGSHHKGFLERLLEPPVVKGVLRRTSRPVLVVSDEG